MSFTIYDNLDDITAANYVLNDKNIIPNKGSVNPFVPGNLVEGKPRNFTAWFWPNNVPVPAGLPNVILYPTKPAFPGTGAARWAVAFRQYHPQPGHPTVEGYLNNKVTAVSTRTMRPVRCPLSAAAAYPLQLASTYAHLKYWGPVQKPPEPAKGNKIYFTTAPAAIFLGLDGYPGPLPKSCLQYMVASLSPNEISVTTMHAVPEYFNNDLVTSTSVMKDYPIRYQSFGVNYFTLNTRLYNSGWINTDDSVYTSKGEWVVVWLPAEPRLSRAEIAQVKAVAKAQNFNVIQLPPRSRTLPGSLLPYPTITIRQKTVSSSFPYSNLNLSCWSQTHNYKNWSAPKGAAYFAKYASSPLNNGPYWTDGVKVTFAQFMANY